MTKVPDINKPEPPKQRSVMYVCTTDNKPLTPEDQKALEEFMQYRIDRAKRQKSANTLPHPFKCSKCDFVAATAAESRQHWFDEHTD